MMLIECDHCGAFVDYIVYVFSECPQCGKRPPINFTEKRRPKKLIYYKKILTKEVLIEEYVKNKKSTTQIGTQFNCPAITVFRHLKKHKIPIRTKSESIHLRRKNNFLIDDQSKNYIDGLIIGDGSLGNHNKWSAGYFQGFAIRYNEWAEKIQNDFKTFGIKSNLAERTLPERIIKKGKVTPPSDIVILWTHSYEEFLFFRKRWYPNGRKEIPKDLEINAQMLANWYMGDGSINSRQKYIVLSSLSFDKIKKLNND